MYLVTLDVGTGGLHVAVYHRSGRLLAESYSVFGYCQDAHPRSMVFSPESLFDDAMNHVSATLEKASLPENSTLIFSLTGQRHGSVFLDDSMKPVLAVANLDGRVGVETVQAFQPHFSRVYDICGRLPSEIFPAMRLFWMKRHQQELYKRIHGFLMINEWFAFRLCGKPHAEKTSVSESLLFDIRQEGWSREMLSLFEQEELQQWPVVDPGAIVGEITDEMATRCRLPHGTLISLGAGDTQCAAVGSRAFDAGDIVIVNGSTTPVVMVTDTLSPDPARKTWANLYDGKRFLIESNAGRTGMIYRDVARILSCQDVPEADVSRVLEVEKLGVRASLVPDPGRPVDFLGYESRIVFRADPVPVVHLLPYLLLENTAFAVAAHVENVRNVSGINVRNVYLTGGSSRSKLTQAIASVLLEELPLYLTLNYDTTSKGASMMALARWDERIRLEDAFAEADAEQRVQPLEPVVNEEIREVIHARYDIWKDSYTDNARVGV